MSSRISRYQESIKKFMKNKSCLSQLGESVSNNIITNTDHQDQYIFSILLLTILNSQNRKNHLLFQGYYAAVTIEFIKIMMDTVDSDHKLAINLLLISIKSLFQNMDVAKRHCNPDKIFEMRSQLTDLLFDCLGPKGFAKQTIVNPNGKIKNDIIKYYLEGNKNAINILSKINVVNNKYLDEITELKTCKLAQLSVKIAWILGSGDSDKLDIVEKVGKHFGYMYKLASDFQNIDSDIYKANNFSTNYIINNGFHDTYEKFMNHKHKFMEGLIELDIYTGTIKELLKMIELWVDNVIDKTTPDLVSNYSTIHTII